MITFKKNLETFNKIANRYYFIKDNLDIKTLKASLKRFNVTNIWKKDDDILIIETDNLIITILLDSKRVSENVIMKGSAGEIIKYNMVSGNINLGE